MKPVLLLLPGLSGTPQLMKWITPYLEPYFDLRPTQLPEPKVSGDQNYNVLSSYIYQNYVSQENNLCWILGESFSGPIAITLAKNYPQKIKGVILAASFATSPNSLARKLQKLLPLILAFKPARQIGGLAFLCGSHAFKLPTDMRHTILSELKSTPVQTIKERLATVIACDIRSYLPLTQPVLYLRAKQDWLVGKQALNTLHHLQPQMQITSFNSPHLLLQIRAQETADAIRNFVTRLDHEKE